MDKVGRDIWNLAIKTYLAHCNPHSRYQKHWGREKSRQQELRTEWILNKETSKKFQLIFRLIQITSRLNFQIERFLSYRPDTQSIAVNAFTLDSFLCLPLFAIIPRVIENILQDIASGIPYLEKSVSLISLFLL